MRSLGIIMVWQQMTVAMMKVFQPWDKLLNTKVFWTPKWYILLGYTSTATPAMASLHLEPKRLVEG